MGAENSVSPAAKHSGGGREVGTALRPVGMHNMRSSCKSRIRVRDRVCARDALPQARVLSSSLASEIAPITDQGCARWSQMLSTVVSSAGSRAATPTWMSTGAGVSTGTAARVGGSKGERVPRTGWRFVHHLNRLSALAFLRPVRKVSLGAEFPAPFREPILRPGLPTPLPRAGQAEHTKAPSGPRDPRFVALGKSEIFVLRPREGCTNPNQGFDPDPLQSGGISEQRRPAS